MLTVFAVRYAEAAQDFDAPALPDHCQAVTVVLNVQKDLGKAFEQKAVEKLDDVYLQRTPNHQRMFCAEAHCAASRHHHLD